MLLVVHQAHCCLEQEIHRLLALSPLASLLQRPGICMMSDCMSARAVRALHGETCECLCARLGWLVLLAAWHVKKWSKVLNAIIIHRMDQENGDGFIAIEEAYDPTADAATAGNQEPEQQALPPPPVKRHRWGPAMNEPPPAAAADGGADGREHGGGEKKRKRKSRWETDDSKALAIVPSDGSSRALIAVFPKEVTLSNGITVRALSLHAAAPDR